MTCFISDLSIDNHRSLSLSLSLSPLLTSFPFPSLCLFVSASLPPSLGRTRQDYSRTVLWPGPSCQQGFLRVQRPARVCLTLACLRRPPHACLKRGSAAARRGVPISSGVRRRRLAGIRASSCVPLNPEWAHRDTSDAAGGHYGKPTTRNPERT